VSKDKSFAPIQDDDIAAICALLNTNDTTPTVIANPKGGSNPIPSILSLRGA